MDRYESEIYGVGEVQRGAKGKERDLAGQVHPPLGVIGEKSKAGKVAKEDSQSDGEFVMIIREHICRDCGRRMVFFGVTEKGEIKYCCDNCYRKIEVKEEGKPVNIR